MQTQRETPEQLNQDLCFYLYNITNMGLVYWFIGVYRLSNSEDHIKAVKHDDADEISFLVEETGVPGGNHRPTASNSVVSSGYSGFLHPEENHQVTNMGNVLQNT